MRSGSSLAIAVKKNAAPLGCQLQKRLRPERGAKPPSESERGGAPRAMGKAYREQEASLVITSLVAQPVLPRAP